MSRQCRLGRWLLAGVLLGLGGGTLAAGEAPSAPAPGGKVPDTGSLRDLRGNRRPLHSFGDHQAVVLAFLGTDCASESMTL